MRISILIIFLILYNHCVSAQKDTAFFFDLLCISINQTHVKDDNTENRYGFGLSAYHIFRNDKIINLVFGVEYNRNSQFKKYVYEGHFQNSANVTYNINYLSFPLTTRLNIGNKIKLFIEAGVFADINVSARMKGTRFSNYPNQNNQLISSESTFNEKAYISNRNSGTSLGIGLRIPLSKYEVLIKADYKNGLSELFYTTNKTTNSYFRLMVGIKI